jgi:hypothetical protein
VRSINYDAVVTRLLDLPDDDPDADADDATVLGRFVEVDGALVVRTRDGRDLPVD